MAAGLSGCSQGDSEATRDDPDTGLAEVFGFTSSEQVKLAPGGDGVIVAGVVDGRVVTGTCDWEAACEPTATRRIAGDHGTSVGLVSNGPTGVVLHVLTCRTAADPCPSDQLALELFDERGDRLLGVPVPLGDYDLPNELGPTSSAVAVDGSVMVVTRPAPDVVTRGDGSIEPPENVDELGQATFQLTVLSLDSSNRVTTIRTIPNWSNQGGFIPAAEGVLLIEPGAVLLNLGQVLDEEDSTSMSATFPTESGLSSLSSEWDGKVLPLEACAVGDRVFAVVDDGIEDDAAPPGQDDRRHGGGRQLELLVM